MPADAGGVGRLAVEEKSDASSFDLIISNWQDPGKRIVAKQADGVFCHLDCQPVPRGGQGRDGEDCQGRRRLLPAKRGEVEGHLLQKSYCYQVVWMYIVYMVKPSPSLLLLLLEASTRVLTDCGWKDIRE